MTEKAKDDHEKPEKEPENKQPVEVQRGGVIGGQAHQEHWKGMDKAHWLDQDESATGLFFKPGEKGGSTSKFGIDGLDADVPGQEAPRKNADGTPYRVFNQPASMSPTPIAKDSISPELTQGDFQSSVKLNVQISQIPEVSKPISAHGAVEYTSTVIAAGAEAVRAAGEHFAEPNAINNDIVGALEHFSHSPEQTNNDLRSAVSGLMEKLEKAMTPEQRAEMAGSILPMFFFSGEKEPIHPRVARGMGIDKMSEEELGALSLERRNTLAGETVGEVNPRVYSAPSRLVQERIAELSDALPNELGGRVSLSAAVVEDLQGKRSFLIGSSERFGYLRGIEPKAGETVIAGPNRHPVLDLLEHAGENRLKIIDIGSTGSICEHCAAKIAESGAHLTSIVK